jgi:DNA-directed RNA polymerase subunit RPC12/RpoP
MDVDMNNAEPVGANVGIDADAPAPKVFLRDVGVLHEFECFPEMTIGHVMERFRDRTNIVLETDKVTVHGEPVQSHDQVDAGVTLVARLDIQIEDKKCGDEASKVVQVCVCCLSLCLSVSLSLCLSVSLSLCLSVSLSVGLTLCLGSRSHRLTIRLYHLPLPLAQTHQVYESERVGAIMTKYAAKAKRVLHESKSIHEAAPTCYVVFGEERMDPQRTVYQYRIDHGSTVYFESPEFRIRVEYSKDGVFAPGMRNSAELLVHDSMTIAKVRDVFKTETQEVLDDDDRLLHDGHALDINLMLYKYRLSYGAVLKLERADLSSSHRYICADCGSEVRLKPSDPVVCRECGYRIVYKARIPASTLFACLLVCLLLDDCIVFCYDIILTAYH